MIANLYCFPGHLDVSGKLAKVYHLAFISVFKKGSNLIVLNFYTKYM